MSNCDSASIIKHNFIHIGGLTDTSRGADSLVSLVAISDKIKSQKLNVVLLPWVWIDVKKTC